MENVSVIGPPLAECLKDGSTPVRLAAERCALHLFQLTKGTESVELLSAIYAYDILGNFWCINTSVSRHLSANSSSNGIFY